MDRKFHNSSSQPAWHTRKSIYREIPYQLGQQRPQSALPKFDTSALGSLLARKESPAKYRRPLSAAAARVQSHNGKLTGRRLNPSRPQRYLFKSDLQREFGTFDKHTVKHALPITNPGFSSIHSNQSSPFKRPDSAPATKQRGDRPVVRQTQHRAQQGSTISGQDLKASYWNGSTLNHQSTRRPMTADAGGRGGRRHVNDSIYMLSVASSARSGKLVYQQCAYKPNSEIATTPIQVTCSKDEFWIVLDTEILGATGPKVIQRTSASCFAGGDCIQQNSIEHKLPVPAIDGISVVRCGLGHVIFLTTSGHVFGMGINDAGQLSRRVLKAHPIPVERDQNSQTTRVFQICSPERFDSSIVDIQCGPKCTSLRTESGQVWAFGDNGNGQLGTGKIEKFTSQPTLVCDLPIGDKVQRVSHGTTHTLFLLHSGRLMFTGRHASDQRTWITSKSPDFVPVPKGSDNNNLVYQAPRIVTIVAGYEYSVAVLSNGLLITWGVTNDVSTVDIPATNGKEGFPAPKRVMGMWGARVKFRSVACTSHCILAVSMAGNLYMVPVDRNENVSQIDLNGGYVNSISSSPWTRIASAYRSAQTQHDSPNPTQGELVRASDSNVSQPSFHKPTPKPNKITHSVAIIPQPETGRNLQTQIVVNSDLRKMKTLCIVSKQCWPPPPRASNFSFPMSFNKTSSTQLRCTMETNIKSKSTCAFIFQVLAEENKIILGKKKVALLEGTPHVCNLDGIKIDLSTKEVSDLQWSTLGSSSKVSNPNILTVPCCLKTVTVIAQHTQRVIRCGQRLCWKVNSCTGMELSEIATEPGVRVIAVRQHGVDKSIEVLQWSSTTTPQADGTSFQFVPSKTGVFSIQLQTVTSFDWTKTGNRNLVPVWTKLITVCDVHVQPGFPCAAESCCTLSIRDKIPSVTIKTRDGFGQQCNLNAFPGDLSMLIIAVDDFVLHSPELVVDESRITLTHPALQYATMLAVKFDGKHVTGSPMAINTGQQEVQLDTQMECNDLNCDSKCRWSIGHRLVIVSETTYDITLHADITHLSTIGHYKLRIQPVIMSTNTGIGDNEVFVNLKLDNGNILKGKWNVNSTWKNLLKQQHGFVMLKLTLLFVMELNEIPDATVCQTKSWELGTQTDSIVLVGASLSNFHLSGMINAEYLTQFSFNMYLSRNESNDVVPATMVKACRAMMFEQHQEQLLVLKVSEGDDEFLSSFLTHIRFVLENVQSEKQLKAASLHKGWKLKAKLILTILDCYCEDFKETALASVTEAKLGECFVGNVLVSKQPDVSLHKWAKAITFGVACTRSQGLDVVLKVEGDELKVFVGPEERSQDFQRELFHI